MKKIVSVFLSVCMIFSAVLALVACGHTHVFSSDWTFDENYHWHDCDAEGCTEVADYATHTFGGWSSISDIQHKKECICGKEVLANHEWGDWASISDTQHKKACECGAEIAEGHTWGEGVITTEPTPDADGVETFTCTGCGETKEMPIAYAHQHNYGDWVSISATQHKKVCECEAEVVANHEWDDGEITEPATPDADGVKTFTCTGCGETYTVAVPYAVINPYANVNWSTADQVKSMSHWHILTQAEFDMAIADGYRHFAISHYQPSEPRENLSDYFTNVPNNILSSPNSEKPNASNTRGDYHFNALGSYAVGGGHTSAEKENLLPWQTMYDDTFANLKYPDGGGITINHPMYYPTQNMATIFEMLDYDERVLGVEMFNGDYGMFNPGEGQDKIYDTRYIDVWDTILATGRRCWGFSVIDWYNPNHKKGSNMLVTPEFTEEACLKAYRNGEFYMQVKDTGLRFTDIKYENGLVTVSVNKDAIINFVTQDGDVKTVSGRTASYAPTTDDIYVRVEVADAADTEACIFSNPFMFKTREEVAAAYDGSVNLNDGNVAYDINNSNVEGGTTTTVVYEKDGVFSTTDNGGTKYTIEWYNYGTAGPNLDGTSYNITKRLEIKSIKQGSSTDEATITWNGKTYAAGDTVYRSGQNFWLGLSDFMGWAYPSTVFKPSYSINPIAKNGEVATFEATLKVEIGDFHHNGSYYVLENFLNLALREGSTAKVKVGLTVAGGASNFIDVKGPTGSFYTATPEGRGVVGEEFTVRIEITEATTEGKYQIKTLVNGVLIDTCEVTAFSVDNLYVTDIPAVARDVSVTLSGVKFLKYVDSYDSHTHVFNDEWSTDADNHWHEAICDEHIGCSYVPNKDLGAHEDDDEDGKCDVCEKVLTGTITVDNRYNLAHTIPTTPVSVGDSVTFTITVPNPYGVTVVGAEQVGEPTVDGTSRVYTFKIEAVDPSTPVRIERIKEGCVNKVDYSDTSIRTQADGETTTYIFVNNGAVSAATEANYHYAFTWKNRAVAGPNLDGTSFTFGRQKLILSVKAFGSTEETSFTVGGITYSQGSVIGTRPFLDNATIDGVNHVMMFNTKAITSPTDSTGGPITALSGNTVLTAPANDSKLRFVFDTNMTVAAGTLTATQQIKIVYAAETNRTSTANYDFVERRGNDVYIVFGGNSYRVAEVGQEFNYRVEFREIETTLTEDPNQAGKSYKPFEMKLFINGTLIATREEQIDAGSGNYDTVPQRVEFNTLSSSCDISVTFTETYIDRYE